MKKKSGPFEVIEDDSGVVLQDAGLVTQAMVQCEATPQEALYSNSQSNTYAKNASSVDQSLRPHRDIYRRYECKHYQNCLEIAAALNWQSFSCSNNSLSDESYIECTGQVDEKLVWKAHLAKRDDRIARKLCELPEITCNENLSPKESLEGLSEGNLSESSQLDSGIDSDIGSEEESTGMGQLILVEKRAFRRNLA